MYVSFNIYFDTHSGCFPIISSKDEYVDGPAVWTMWRKRLYSNPMKKESPNNGLSFSSPRVGTGLAVTATHELSRSIHRCPKLTQIWASHIQCSAPASPRTAQLLRSYVLSTGVCVPAQLAVRAEF